MKPTPFEKNVSRDDFPWEQSLESISALEETIYLSEKRLPKRAYTRNDEVILPIPEEKASSWGFNFNSLQLNDLFIDKLTMHIQKIISANLGSEIIYSDIGHTHIFASLEDLQTLKAEDLDSSESVFYERIFNSENTKFLYHTAEQLRVPQTDEERHRKAHRTIVGKANGDIYEVPFTKTISGYSQFFSIYFNASALGCFSVNGKKFDISISSPQ